MWQHMKQLTPGLVPPTTALQLLANFEQHFLCTALLQTENNKVTRIYDTNSFLFQESKISGFWENYFKSINAPERVYLGTQILATSHDYTSRKKWEYQTALTRICVSCVPEIKK